MPIAFQEQLKRQKGLIVVFVVLVLLTAIIVWRGFYVQEDVAIKIISKRYRKINVDFTVLDKPLLVDLELMGIIPPLEGEPGRGNPFIPVR